MKYEGIENEELIEIARSGDMEAREYFFNKNRRLAFKVAQKYIKNHDNPSDNDDIMSESLVGLFRAYRKFDSSKEVKFSSFATTVVNNYLSNFMRDYGKQKRLPEVSMFQTIYKHKHGNGEDVTLEDNLASDNVGNDEHVIYQNVLNEFLNEASEIEKKVYYYCIKKDMLQKDVGNLLGRDQSNVSAILRKIKKRLSYQLQTV